MSEQDHRPFVCAEPAQAAEEMTLAEAMAALKKAHADSVEATGLAFPADARNAIEQNLRLAQDAAGAILARLSGGYSPEDFIKYGVR